MGSAIALLCSFFPPDLDPHYLVALAGPLVQTLGLTLAATTIAYCLGLFLALAQRLRIKGAAALVGALSLLRSVPDLTLAILCVIVFGLGAGAGLVALAIYYTAAVAKMFADLLETVEPRPVEALSAIGATRVQTACYGLVPLAAEGLFTYGAFAFECAFRSSIIIGAVGGGGFGTELVGTIAAFDFHRTTTLIILLVLVIALFDRIALTVRRRPRLLLALLPLGLLAAAWLAPDTFAFHHGVSVLIRMVPPRLPAAAWFHLPLLVLETVWMAFASTAMAYVAAVLVAILASRKLAPPWMRVIVRRACELLRTIPEVVWGLVLVALVGVGPTAGIWALGLHSFGTLGRLFADVLDTVPEGPQEALAATGASRAQIVGFATLPLALPELAAHALFRFDWNLRMATVLGLIGAGGIGQALYEAQQLFFYRQVFAYVLITATIIFATDWLSARLRARINRPSVRGDWARQGAAVEVGDQRSGAEATASSPRFGGSPSLLD
ncbi:MAG: PhnE/PtxC family ABC transporter permease [Sphingomonas sp.]